MESWYLIPKKEILSRLKSSKNGLTNEQANALLKENGENALLEGKKKSTLRVFLEQFLDLLVIILIVAAIVSALTGDLESMLVIVSVIVLNAILGTVQHEKAAKSLASLKNLSSPSAKVLRDGVKIEIPSKLVVPGDILILEAGDLVAADGRILNNYSLQVNESSLTGESTNVDKSDEDLSDEIPLADRTNMVYSGSLVTYGRAVVAVTSTGMDTEIGKIASLMNATKEKKTPLQVSLDKFSSSLAIVIMIICAIVFGLTYWQSGHVLDSLLFAVALAVAAIPEALSSIVTIVQAMGTQKMAKEQAIIKDLKAVESLGCVSVICSDKTGTLTQNKMTVQQLYIDGKVINPDEIDIKNQLHRYMLYDAILSNDSSIVDGNGIGDPTEFCLLEMADKIELDYNFVRDALDRLEEIPFDSDRKLMSTKYKLHGVPTVLTKGALDVLLDRTTHIRTSDGIRKITKEDIDSITNQNFEFSNNGLRVLAFAYKEVEDNFTLSLENENGFTFIGLISMIDPPREESIDAVADAKRAGIKPVMITGDHKITATAIAKQIGIWNEGDISVTGSELDNMSEEELNEKIEKISVYARVSPENKIRIVSAWQNKGSIVAMTGDGVNDAPALKKADIGVAMGITGTEVSKDAASMILADDNFATIIKAVTNGRNVYRNIKNAIKFLLSGNMAAILSVLYVSILASFIPGLPVPFAPVHLLFINLLTDSLPAIAIGMEPAERGLLNQKPRDPKEGILTKEFMLKLLGIGGLIAIFTMSSYHIGFSTGGKLTAMTMAFATLTLARLFHGFNCRSSKSIFKLGFTSNPWSLGAFALGVILLSLVLFIPPLQSIFTVAPLSLLQLLYVLLFALAPTIIIQICKVIRDSFKR
ncbi:MULTISPECIES: cation-translocating P-type ATPase [unclassified Ruminococcus]|uniref:cation-translocating P-type ATPase n=1 Tax=unclassified Ruminococcus TaxID=2608920 RepID=UPI0021090E8D|nr:MULTISPECIES: cation-translocating P-type ATPase [unclassified Ruminococcus]MCQ4022654.1 HAD-IC family P-type ATPase [Ruminococcus sp. zg-924]MCQ4114894.1 HAD-IC family P-type ATPase [Ruminococcus sp. zg-921]